MRKYILILAFSIILPVFVLGIVTIEIRGYTTSDWTQIEMNSPVIDGEVIEYKGIGNCQIIPWGIAIHKPQFDESKASFHIKLTFEDFIIEPEVVIKKGDIGETYVEIYASLESETVKIATLKNSENIADDPTNRKEFKITLNKLGENTNNDKKTEYERKTPRLTLAFYYAWYGTPEGPMGNGRWLHWYGAGMYYQGTNHPEIGLYDSWDEEILRAHMSEAVESGIDGFVVSWWGPGSYETDTIKKMLNIAKELNKKGKRFYISLYYEGYERWATRQETVDELCFALEEFAKDEYFLKVNGKPVIFIYSRAINSLSKEDWEYVVSQVREKCGPALFIADTLGAKFAKLFGGLHTYNVCGTFRKLPQMKLGLRFMNFQARKNGIIHVMNIMPGYDDTHVRVPGFSVDRENGKLYEELWKLVLNLDPDMVVITSWNEWHEGSEIEPSLEYGRKYLEITKKWSELWKERDQTKINKEALTGFFKKQFVPEINLLRASMYVKPDNKRIYIASDNLLAAYALRLLNDPLADTIEKELEKYNNGYDEKHEIIIGVKIPAIFYRRYNEYITSEFTEKFGLIDILYEKPDKSVIINSWKNYADLVVYRALNFLLDGNVREAENLFKTLMKMCDGYGFKDKAFKSYYETYKTGLMVLLAKRLEKAGSKIADDYRYEIEKAKLILTKTQAPEGGFTVGYEAKSGEIIQADDTNTETTSIVTIALLE
ncbi:MAG: hypothetical protein PWQ27_757 [Kosmotoga sp.]|nr:hypothetical protein [Kosmotoga sp.]